MASISSFSGISSASMNISRESAGAQLTALQASSLEDFASMLVQHEQQTSDAVATVDEEETDKKQAIIDEFLKFMAMTPAERLWLQFLKQEGLTQAAFDALSKDQQLKIEARIREKIELALHEGMAKNEEDSARTADASGGLLARKKELSLDLYFSSKPSRDRSALPSMHEGDATKLDALAASQIKAPIMHEGDAIKIDAALAAR